MKKLFYLLVLTLLLIASCKKANKVIINYDDDGLVTTITYDLKENNDLMNVVKEGYDFIGWFDGEERINEFPTEAGTYNFKSHFEIKKFTVQYNDETKEAIQVDYNTVFVPKKLDDKLNSKFLGWSLNYNSNEIIDKITIASNINLYPVYEEVDRYKLIDDAIAAINIPKEITTDLNLITSYNGVSIVWKSDFPTIINNKGNVFRQEYEAVVILTATFQCEGLIRKKTYRVVVYKLSDITVLNNVLNNYKFIGEIKHGRFVLKDDFSTDYNTIESYWESNAQSYVSNDGVIIMYPDEQLNFEFSLTLKLGEEKVSKKYNAILNPLPFNELVDLALEQEVIEDYIHTSKIYLPTEFEYGIKGTWSSEDSSVINPNGDVKINNETSKQLTKIKMTLTLTRGSEKLEKEFIFKIQTKEGLIVEHPLSMNKESMTNLKIVETYLVLNDDAVEGSYLSDEISTADFISLVPTWDAVTSVDATVQFLIRVKVGDTWSDYVKYSDSGWGLGLKNKCYNQDAGVAELIEDEFMVKKGLTANKIQYQLILRRTNLDVVSPKVTLVTCALELKNKPDNIFKDNIYPESVIYQVPKLYQRVVPGIGGVICSATSSTMLLNYKGLSFVDKDPQYEHRYIASLVKEYNSNVYGNWCFNCVARGAYGFYAYVERLFSIEELVHHLVNVGPVAISVKGQMTSNKKDYYTAGHLLVIKGYTKDTNGEYVFTANDPNVLEVECTYTRSVIENVWRYIIYTIE